MQLGETDLRVNGRQVWLWDSQRDTATRILPPVAPLAATGRAAAGDEVVVRQAALGGLVLFVLPQPRLERVSLRPAWPTQSTLTISLPTPQQVASSCCAAVGPTTTVGVQSNVMVAGRPAYQLTLAPKSAGLPDRPGHHRGRRQPVLSRCGCRSSPAARPARPSRSATPRSRSAARPRPTSRSRRRLAPRCRPSGPSPGLLLGLPLGAMSGITAAYSPARRGIGSSAMARSSGPAGARRTAVRLLPLNARHHGRAAAEGQPHHEPARGPPKATPIPLPRHLSKSQRQHMLKVLKMHVARPAACIAGPGWHGAGWYGIRAGNRHALPAQR